jgi:poly(beta-D-mannuronate) lyase
MERCFNNSLKVKVNFIIKIGLIVIFKSFNVLDLYAAVYMVSNSTEITAAMSSAQPGDTLKMQNGIWTNQIINFGGANGTNGAPIVLMAQTLGQVYMEGNSRLKIFGNHLVVDGIIFRNPTPSSLGTNHIIEFRNGSTLANNCRITNIEISYYNSDNSVDNKWVSLYGTHNKVDHCKFQGKSNYGPVMVIWYQNVGGFPNESPSTYHLIENNYFLNRTLPLGGNGGETIRVGDSNTSRTNGHNIFQYNLFEHCDGEIEIISNKSEYNIYRYNTFRENSGQLTLRHGAFCIIEGNYFLGNNYAGSSGVRIIDSSHIVRNNYFEALSGGNQGNLRAPITIMNGDINPAANGYWPVRQCSIYNNTFVNCIAPSMRIGVESDIVPANGYIHNNIYYGTAGPFIENTNVPINFQYNNNVFYGASLGIVSGGFTSIDPSLSNGGPSGLYRLIHNSPVIDGGTTNMLVDDMDGQNRVSNPDIGCDEYSTQAIIRYPLASTDVGPCWLNGGMMCQNLPLAIAKLDLYGIKSGNAIKIKLSAESDDKNLGQLLKYDYSTLRWIHQSNIILDKNNRFEFEDVQPTAGHNTYQVIDHNMIDILGEINVNYELQGENKIGITYINHELEINNLIEPKISKAIVYSLTGEKLKEMNTQKVDLILIGTTSFPQIFVLSLFIEHKNIENKIIFKN